MTHLVIRIQKCNLKAKDIIFDHKNSMFLLKSLSYFKLYHLVLC